MHDILLFSFLTISSMYDLLTRKVPNQLIAIATVTGVAVALLPSSNLNLVLALMGFALGLALFLPPFLVGAMGAADVKVFAVSGLYLGPFATINAFIYTLLCGGVLAFLYWIFARVHGYPIGGWRVLDKQAKSSTHSMNSTPRVTLPYVVAIFFGVFLNNLITIINN